MPRPIRSTSSRPGFCNLLSLGVFICYLGAACGALCMVMGIGGLESNPANSVFLLVVGTGSLFQSLVLLGIIQALLWLVDNATKGTSPLQEQPRGEVDYDPDPQPVIRRRKFSP